MGRIRLLVKTGVGRLLPGLNSILRPFFEDRPSTGWSAFVRDDTGGFVSCRTGFTDGVLSPEAAEDGLVRCKLTM